MKTFLKSITFIVLIIILNLAWARNINRDIERNIYYPNKVIYTSPESTGLPYEKVYFETSDNKQLYGLFFLNNEAKFTILFCQGNTGNLSYRLEKMARFCNEGFNIFIFDYRGFGRSEGSPSERGLYEDAASAYNYLTKTRKIPGNNIILYGESLGGAVAVDLAAKEDVRALITEDTITSIKDMAKIYYPRVPPFMIKTKFDTVSKIRNITCPKLIIHSVNDEIVPFHIGEKLFNIASPPKKFLKIRGSHWTAAQDSEEKFREGLTSFLAEL